MTSGDTGHGGDTRGRKPRHRKKGGGGPKPGAPGKGRRKKGKRFMPIPSRRGLSTKGAIRPTQDDMRRLLGQGGIEVDDLQLDLFWRFYLRIAARNEEYNLTRISRFEDIVFKHFVDCAVVPLKVALPSPLLDIGTGPGFPGVPLRIVCPELRITLAEGRKRRVEFLEEVLASLRLSGLRVHGRNITPEYTEPHAGVITRAVESIIATLERVDGCLQPGGRAVFMKGPSVDPELAEAQSRLAGRYQLVADEAFVLPGTDYDRRLVVFERLG